MIARSSDLADLFEAIKADVYNSEEKGVVIFVSAIEADSVCAAQQLTHVLARQNTPYNQFPVYHYQDIAELYRKHVGEPMELCTIIFINCGGTQDIRRICPEMNDNVRAIIVDSHRPIYHGYNVDTDTSVVVLVDDDDAVPRAHIPLYLEQDRRAEVGEADEAEASGSGEDDDDLMDQDEERGSPGLGRRGRGGGGGGGGEGAAAADSPGARRAAKRQKREQDALDVRKRRSELDEYYEGKSGWGKPSSLLLYELVRDVHADSTFQLWLAILGLTEQFLQQRTDLLSYEKWRGHIEGWLAALGIAAPKQDAARDGVFNKQACHNVVVTPIQDLRLTLHRHWNLFDSMRFTNYIAARLQTWRERGVDNLRGLLAKMGLLLRDADRDWHGMRPETHQKLRQQLKTYGPHYNLNMDQLTFNSFEFQFEHEMRMTASDMVLAITAMLIRPQQAGIGSARHANFNDAGDLLHTKSNVRTLQEAIKRSKTLAEAIVREGGLVLTRGHVVGKKLGVFCHCNMSTEDYAKQDIFGHPASLVKLAIFLRDAQVQRLGGAKPFVLVGPADSAGNSYVVTLRSKHQPGVMQHNPFSRAFADVVALTGIQSETLNFDSTLMHMKQSSAQNFLIELGTLLDDAAREHKRGV